jgi:protein-disulfide isomerase
MAEEKKIFNLTMPLLAILVAVAAFLAGSFWTKIRYLEGEGGEGTGEEVALAEPEILGENIVLGEEEVGKIEEGGAGVKGKEDAPITIVEFSEYQCPFCAQYVEEAYQDIWRGYDDKIRYIFRDFPLSFHQHAQTMAEAARCAGDQGQYWEMHDLLFEKNEEWSAEEDVTSLLTSYASQLGLDKDEFNNCLDSGKYNQAVKDDFSLGQNIGVSGTPTFFINGRQLVGAQPFEAFKTIIEEELNK